MNRDSESLLAQLMTTPVGRRWILKAGLGSAAAVAAATLSRSTSATAWAASLEPTATPTRGSQSTTTSGASQPKPVANRTLHFALTSATAGGLSNLKLIANGARTPLVAHTAESRAALQNQGGIFAVADLSRFSHYVQDVPLPSDRALLVSVHGTRGNDEVLVAQTMHTPAATALAMADIAAASGNGLGSMAGSDSRLTSLGLSPAQVTTSQHIDQLDAVVDPHTTAVTLAFLHPQTATVDTTSAQATKDLLHQTPNVVTLGNYIGTMHSQGKDWGKLVPATNADGSASQIEVSGTTSSFSTMQLNPSGDKNFQPALKAAVSSGVVAVRDTGSLGTVVDKPISDYPKGTPINTWVQSQGTTPRPKPYTPPTLSPMALGSGTVDVSVKNTGYPSGTRTEALSGYKDGQVQVRIYNNFVRWVWAYVQYIGTDKDGNEVNLSASPKQGWPDTSYSKSVALVPQVFTLLGIPLWDTNTTDVTLTFPQDAHTARLLYCGLGSDIRGGGWRQYFPDDAYPDRIAPTDEVLAAALITGILTIGMNVFALATDFAVASAWDAVRNDVQSALAGAPSDLETAMKLAGQTETATLLTKVESGALAVTTGAATYLDIADRGDDVTNIWSILLGLVTIIPKLLFSPTHLGGEGFGFWRNIGLKIAGLEAGQKITEAIPLIGEAIAIVEVVGDVATLAEVAAETIVSPWVIENEVNLTYQANVTIDHDPVASGWPATATTWELSYVLDGGSTQDSMTENMNVGGRTGSDPLDLTLTAPFGSGTIQWSIVIKDADGHQVGTGLSQSFTNNDPNNPPSSVAFAITEIPEPITADTVFKRADTLVYSDSAGGFTWSNAASDTGAADAATPSTTPAIQQVTGATVATTLGVVGVVWKENDQYYLQGIPVDENGTTIALPPVSKGYARPPFLLFDSFVHRDNPSQSNHVLLEPDDGTDAYFVRKVNLDPTTGAITWDSTKALGTFLLPVSAAALHSSGHVVAIHTDSGRVGFLKPVDTLLPSPASYTGGTGSQTGLTQSPTAVAVTNPGVVLVLESGASQLAAFDLNGNPVQYFGADSSNLHYTQPLATPGTYLDLAVDGASHIYLLYYTGDGSQPDDYHVDVYNPDGEPLATQNPGVNVSRLSVDFWRSIYGVNFTAMNAPGATVSVPSISRFDPRDANKSAASARHA